MTQTTSEFLRAMNAAVKKQFKDRNGFIPVKCNFFGSFFSCRAEGSMPIDLAHDISDFVFNEAKKTVPTLTRIAGSDYSWHRNGTVITFSLH